MSRRGSFGAGASSGASPAGSNGDVQVKSGTTLASGGPITALAKIVNTDGDPGRTIYVGSIDPEVEFGDDLVDGDVWIEQ